MPSRSIPLHDWLLLLLLIGMGATVGVLSDYLWWSALLLQLEPFLLVGGAFLVWLRWSSAQWARGAVALVGVVISFVLVRVPWPVYPQVQSEPPPWPSQLAGCSANVKWPVDSVRVLQWTVGGTVDVAEVYTTAIALKPDIFVLDGADSQALVQRIHGELGGEYHAHFRPELGSVVIFTRGLFQRCGEDEEWLRDDNTESLGSFAYVGVTPDTVVPLLVARYGRPLSPEHWYATVIDASTQDVLALQPIISPVTIVLANALTSATYRLLPERFRRLGLMTLPTPPNWPYHVGPLPMLPLHTYDRAWAGPAWELVESRRVAVDSGRRAPILTTLRPRDRTAWAPPITYPSQNGPSHR